MQHKITIDSEQSLQRLIATVTAELSRRQVNVGSCNVLSLFGHYYRDNTGVLPTINIQLKRKYEYSERDLLIQLRGEVERVIAHYSASPLACGMVGPNSFSGLGNGLDYLSNVTPSAGESLFVVEEMNNHHMANYLLRTVNGQFTLAAHAHKEAGVDYNPDLKGFRAMPLENKINRKVLIEAIVPGGHSSVCYSVAKLWFTDAFFNTAFIKKVASLYKFSIVRV